MRIWSLIAASSALLLSAGAASGQSLIASPDFGAPDIYGRGKNVSVLERERPGYQAIGIHNGGFMIYPKLVVTAQTNDNVYASPTKQSDTSVNFTPSVTAQSDWGRHSLMLLASLDQAVFAKFKTENTTAWDIRANGRIDIHGESYINLGADVQHAFEARGSLGSQLNTLHPISFNTEGLYARGLYGEDRIRASVDGSYRAYSYQNQTDTTGAPVQEQSRDYTSAAVSGRVDYALTPDEATFGKVSYSETQYLHGTMDAQASPPGPAPGGQYTDKRNSTEIRALAGANFDLRGLARGELGVGYVERHYQSVNYTALGGLSFAGKLEYFPTKLLTLSALAQRQVVDSAFTSSGGYFQNTVSGEADYEFRQNIILSGALGYERDQYPGANRTDAAWNSQLQGRYFLNRTVGIGATLSYVKRTSTVPYPVAPIFDETRFALSLVFQR